MRLGVKFAIAFFISSIASISFISLLSYTLARNALQETIVTEQQQLTQQTMDSIDRFFSTSAAGIEAIAQNESVSSFVKNTNSAFPVTDQVLEQKVKNAIQTLSPLTGPWEDIDIVNANGTIIYSQHPETIGGTIVKQGFSSWFSGALQGKSMYSDVIKDPESKKESVIFVTPIIDTTIPSHPVSGVVFGHVSWSGVLSILRGATTHNVELYNTHNLLIGDNNPSHGPGSFLTRTTSSSFISQFGQVSTSKTITSAQELISVVSEKGVDGYKGNNWILVIRTPVKIAFAPAVNTAFVIAGLLLPVIIVVNGILLLFILELLRPLNLIGQAAQDIAKGNLTKRVPHTGNDEIGWLADSFNKMADTLEELYAGLEKKVQEKTKELSEKMEDAEAMNSFMIKRELKLIDLKKQIAQLKEQLTEKESKE